MRLIDADALIERWRGCMFEGDITLIIANAPTVEPEPHWIPVSEKAHPDLPIRVQVQMNNGWIITAYYQDGEWLSVPNCEDAIHDEWIEAWRELPERIERKVITVHKYHDPFGNPIYVYMRVGDKTVAIKADDLQKALDYVTEHGEEVTIEGRSDNNDLKHAPTIEPETEEEAYERGYTAGQMAERKLGKWNRDADGLVWCNECGFGKERSDERPYKFCPWCGADMRGEQDG